MLERINKLENCGLSNSHIGEEYKNLVDEFNKIRLQYAFYCKKSRKNLLLLIKEQFKKLIEQEYIMLNEFVNCLKFQLTVNKGNVKQKAEP